MKTKEINFSYPTSPNAKQFKLSSWTVSLAEPGKPPESVAMFKTREEAEEFAETMPEPWSIFHKLLVEKELGYNVKIF